MRAAVDARKAAEQAHRGPREELKMYLEAPLESGECCCLVGSKLLESSPLNLRAADGFPAKLLAVPNSLSHCTGLSGHPGLCHAI
jgi:hypothetical protein